MGIKYNFFQVFTYVISYFFEYSVLKKKSFEYFNYIQISI